MLKWSLVLEYEKRKCFSSRLANEGLPNINFMIGQCRRLNICKEDLIALLNNTDPTKPPSLPTLSAETQESVKDLGRFFKTEIESTLQSCDLFFIQLLVVAF